MKPIDTRDGIPAAMSTPCAAYVQPAAWGRADGVPHQCTRAAMPDSAYCLQHQRVQDRAQARGEVRRTEREKEEAEREKNASDTARQLATGNAPKCAHCHKPLRPLYRRISVRPEGKTSRSIYDWDNPPNIGDHWNGQKIVAVQRLKDRTVGGDGEVLNLMFRVWLGHFGGYGDDRFCGLNCGYRWATSHCPFQIRVKGATAR